MLNRLLPRFSIFILALVLAGICAGYCLLKSENTVKSASIYHIRLDSSNYVGDTIIVKGYLLGEAGKGRGALYLFATKDDALMHNIMAGVYIDSEGNELRGEEDQFVEISGQFQRIEDVMAEKTFGIANPRISNRFGKM